MSSMNFARLDRAFDTLPERYAGPGGAAVVLREGEVLQSRAWGWADPQRRIPFTEATLSLVCSITKQFTCALLLDRFPDPTVLDGDVRAMMPLLENGPATLDLCHNQSGLRDYWAQAMLCGAPVEGRFGDADTARLIGGTASLHFAPGSRYSYVNQNFRILSDIIERRAGTPYAELLKRRLLEPAGMPHARLNPDTSAVAGGTIGHEGTVEDGFRPAVNNIVWTGDAGLAASLLDMIAWEKWIDATRDDPDALYHRQAQPRRFRDGAPASYGFGLNHSPILGHAASAHGGGLRGWRSFRFYVPGERVSVAVLFNHMADARAAAVELFAALIDAPAAQPAIAPGAGWAGRYIEPESNIVAHLEPAGAQMRLHYATGPELLSLDASGDLVGGTTRLRRLSDGLWMERRSENLAVALQPVAGAPTPDVEGVFRSAELAADLTIASAGGVLYGAFSGVLGEGEMHQLIPYAADIWLLPCPRALDYGAPGDWTLRIERNAAGLPIAIRVGCWLARNVVFHRA